MVLGVVCASAKPKKMPSGIFEGSSSQSSTINKKAIHDKWMAFLLVEMTGFEPAASSSRTKRATKLRYISLFFSLAIILYIFLFVNSNFQKF